MEHLKSAFLVGSILFFIAGCATLDSKPQVVKPKIKKSQYEQIFILPIEGPDRRLVADLGITASLPNGKVIPVGHTFDNKDIMNINYNLKCFSIP